MKKSKFFVYSFYRFKEIHQKKYVKQLLDDYLSNKLVRGTILLADEGINGSVSASEIDLVDVIKFIKSV